MQYKYNPINYSSLEDLSISVETRNKTQSKFIKSRIEEKEDSLYLLDEPENSLSPKFQIELIQLISELSRFFKCQFIIATHSPFLLSIPNAKIYDLDSIPVITKNWYELENMRIYYNFFKENKSKFEI